MREKLSPLEKEWLKVEAQEQAYLKKRMEKKDSRLNQLLEKECRKSCKARWMLKSIYEIFAGNSYCRGSRGSV